MTAGSDAHTTVEIGSAYLDIPVFATAEDFKASVAEATIRGQLSPRWVHFISPLNKWRSKLGLKPNVSR
jgi:hypothetical protein